MSINPAIGAWNAAVGPIADHLRNPINAGVPDSWHAAVATAEQLSSPAIAGDPEIALRAQFLWMHAPITETLLAGGQRTPQDVLALYRGLGGMIGGILGMPEDVRQRQDVSQWLNILVAAALVDRAGDASFHTLPVADLISGRDRERTRPSMYVFSANEDGGESVAPLNVSGNSKEYAGRSYDGTLVRANPLTVFRKRIRGMSASAVRDLLASLIAREAHGPLEEGDAALLGRFQSLITHNIGSLLVSDSPIRRGVGVRSRTNIHHPRGWKGNRG